MRYNIIEYLQNLLRMFWHIFKIFITLYKKIILKVYCVKIFAKYFCNITDCILQYYEKNYKNFKF